MPVTEWITIAGFVIQFVGIIIYIARRDADIDKKFAVVHERKVALGRRLDTVENDIHDMRKEISETIKEGFADVRSDIRLLRTEVSRKADR